MTTGQTLERPARRTIGKNKVPWVGWDRMETIIEAGMSRQISTSAASAGELIAVLFLGGFRVSEVVRSHHGGLKPEQLSIKGDYLDFRNVSIMKRYDKIAGTGYYCHETGPHRDRFGRWHGGVHDETHKHFQTERKSEGDAIRQSFAYLKGREKPLAEIVVSLRERTAPGSYLFDFSRVSAYRLVELTDPSTWPHWYRSQRAAQLGALEEQGGYELNPDSLQEYFKWTTPEMARIYGDQTHALDKIKALIRH